MTTTSEPNDPLDVTEKFLDDAWLAGQHRGMGAELAGMLNLDTGIREILLAGQHRDMGADLANTLNLAAGLAAILPVHKRHLALPVRFDGFSDLLGWLSAAPMVRLTHRTQLRLLAHDTEILFLATSRSIGDAVDRASDRNLLRGRSRNLDRAINDVLVLVNALEGILVDALDIVGALDDVLAHALDRDFLRILDLERHLGRALDRIRVHDLDRVRHCSRNLERTLDLVDDIDAIRGVARLPGVDRDLDHLHAVTLERVRVVVDNSDIVKTAVLNLARVHDQAYELAQLLCGTSVQIEVRNLLCGINGRVPVETCWLDPATIGPPETNRLNELATDFTGVDLRGL